MKKETNSNLGTLFNNIPSCNCDICQSACKEKPGWFLPEQIEVLKQYFKVNDIRELLNTGKFAIDWWEETDDILVLAPNIKNNGNIQYPSDPRGECVFFKDGKCEIHSIRPIECEALHHDQDKYSSNGLHEKVAKEWEKIDMLDDFENEIETSSFAGSFMGGFGF